MGWTQNRPARNTTTTRQTRSNHKSQHTEKRKKIKVIFGSNSILIKVHRKIVSKHKHTEKIIEETKRTDLDRRTYGSIQQIKRRHNQNSMLGTPQRQKQKDRNHRRQYQRIGGNALWKKQKDGNLKPVGFASRYLSDTEKKYAINELE